MSAADFVDVIGLLVRAPRYSREIVEITGLNRNTVRKFTRLLHDEGLIKQDVIPNDRGPAAYLWSWNPLIREEKQ